MPIPIMLAIGFVVVYITYQTFKDRWKKKPLATPSSAAGAPVASATTPGPKKGLGMVGVIVWVIVTLLLTWWLTSHYYERKVTRARAQAAKAASVVQLKEEWVFVWRLPPGQFSRGRNGDTLEARIVKNDSESLWFDTPYKYQGSMEVSHNYLSKNGERFVGSWSQSNPKDSGSIYLDKVGDQIWVGQSTCSAGLSYPCTLKRK